MTPVVVAATGVLNDSLFIKLFSFSFVELS